MLAERDVKYGYDTKDIKQKRADIPVPIKNPLADQWEKGKAIQTEIKEFDMKLP
jgi:hypothetical protein